MHIKPFLFLACLTFLSCNSNAQNVRIDSIRNLLSQKGADSAKVLLLDIMAISYPDAQTDSILSVEYQGLALARKIRFLGGEARILQNIAKVLHRIGNLPKALNAAFGALRIEETRQNFRGIAQCYTIIGSIYLAENDLHKVLYYSLAEKEIRAKIDGSSKSWVSQYNLSDIYLKLNQPDSALFYVQEAYQIATQKKDSRIALILAQFGEIYEASGNNQFALYYYRLGFKAAVANQLPAVNSIAQSIAALFDKSGNADSAIFYAKISFDKSVSLGSIQSMLKAALLLSKMYEGKDIVQSYHYYKMAVTAKDSIFSIEKIKELQKLTAEEELHRQEIAEENKKAIERQKHAVQIAVIAIFIPSFFLIVMLLGRLKANPRFIEFLGILSLLFVFEFITLIVHPLLEKWTDHRPVLMLLILVCIASFLVPMHNRIEHWMKQMLVRKHSKK